MISEEAVKMDIACARDGALAEVAKLREQLQQMIAGKVADDQLHQRTIARISERQSKELADLRKEVARLKAELADARESKERSRQWYAERWEPLKQWARKDLPPELCDQFFCIIANAIKTPCGDKPPTLTVQLNLMRHDRDALRERCAKLETALRECVAMIEHQGYVSPPKSAREALAPAPADSLKRAGEHPSVIAAEAACLRQCIVDLEKYDNAGTVALRERYRARLAEINASPEQP